MRLQFLGSVARLADMLLHAGEAFDFDGERRVYPEIRLVYWCGGTPSTAPARQLPRSLNTRTTVPPPWLQAKRGIGAAGESAERVGACCAREDNVLTYRVSST